MFCPRCRADVAAELSTDNRRLLCARCSTELGLATGLAHPGAGRRHSAEIQHESRELLARWKAETPAKVQVMKPATALPERSVGADAELLSAGDAAVTWRIDESHSGQATPPVSGLRAEQPSDFSATGGDATRQPRRPGKRRRRLRKPANGPQSGDSLTTAPSIPRSALNWTILSGQLCSYGGVGLSTCGTALVLWAYFGGPEAYAPGGWLLTTFGQMTLFLGVVMLISGGMEQTQREVVQRIEQLGDRLLRMEFAHGPHDLQGPHFARQRRPEHATEQELVDSESPVATD